MLANENAAIRRGEAALTVAGLPDGYIRSGRRRARLSKERPMARSS